MAVMGERPVPGLDVGTGPYPSAPRENLYNYEKDLTIVIQYIDKKSGDIYSAYIQPTNSAALLDFMHAHGGR